MWGNVGPEIALTLKTELVACFGWIRNQTLNLTMTRYQIPDPPNRSVSAQTQILCKPWQKKLVRAEASHKLLKCFPLMGCWKKCFTVEYIPKGTTTAHCAWGDPRHISTLLFSPVLDSRGGAPLGLCRSCHAGCRGGGQRRGRLRGAVWR